jgi:putative FmdB family regulatory protein
MPLYEYKCSSCGQQQEFLQKLSDPPIVVCPACGKETFSKMLTAAGFQLKGSGWYATDFKGGGTKTTAKDSASGDASKGDAKPSGEGESKKDASPPASGASGSAASS